MVWKKVSQSPPRTYVGTSSNVERFSMLKLPLTADVFSNDQVSFFSLLESSADTSPISFMSPGSPELCLESPEKSPTRLDGTDDNFNPVQVSLLGPNDVTHGEELNPREDTQRSVPFECNNNNYQLTHVRPSVANVRKFSAHLEADAAVNAIYNPLFALKGNNVRPTKFNKNFLSNASLGTTQQLRKKQTFEARKHDNSTDSVSYPEQINKRIKSRIWQNDCESKEIQQLNSQAKIAKRNSDARKGADDNYCHKQQFNISYSNDHENNLDLRDKEKLCSLLAEKATIIGQNKNENRNCYVNHLTDSFLEKVDSKKQKNRLYIQEKQLNKRGQCHDEKGLNNILFNPENLQKMCQKLIIANDKNMCSGTSQESKKETSTISKVPIKRHQGRQVKGFLTTCTISDGIWDQRKFLRKEINRTGSMEQRLLDRMNERWLVEETCARVNDGQSQCYGFVNPTFGKKDPYESCKQFTENVHYRHLKADQRQHENLGPEFFTKICNLWPDLIARLAHDINIDLMSPEVEPKPPDPPNDLPFWPDTIGLNNNPVHQLSNKCCSPQDPSCPQLSMDSIIENINLATVSPDRDDTSRTKKISSMDNQYFSATKGSPGRTRNDDTRLPKSPREKGRKCPSPICGSPRPKQPTLNPHLKEQELIRMEAEIEEEEMITSYIDNVLVEEEDEDEEEEEEGESSETKTDLILQPSTTSRRTERLRRRLPEIPKDKKSFSTASILALRTPTLAEEIQEAESGVDSRSSTPDGLSLLNSRTKPLLVLKCHSYIRDDSCSPDLEFCLPNHDIDSGHSTQHSPDGIKSMSPLALRNHSPLSSSVGVPESHLELLDATHRGLYRFIPRHVDELEIEIGDPIYVQKEADDLWCEGVNLRTEKQGIFPAAHVTDVDYSDFDPTVPKVKKERYLLNYLGSIETLSHKGNQVLCQAVRKIAREDGTSKENGGSSSFQPHSCILEVSDQGIRMVDKSSPVGAVCHDYFYHLKHVSFCGFHPKDPRYFGFITKHPAVQRFACHVFESIDSTRPVAEAVGRAFHRFYKKFIETAYPTEDIYIE